MKNREKLTLTTNVQDSLFIMSEGNPGALTVLMRMLTDTDSADNPTGGMDALMRILLLDGFGIRGPKIWLLWKDCSNQDMNTFNATLRILQCGGLSLEDEIDVNLEKLPRAVPFVDPNLEVDGRLSSDLIKEGIAPMHPLFDKFCKTQVEQFREKFEKAKENWGIK